MRHERKEIQGRRLLGAALAYVAYFAVKSLLQDYSTQDYLL